MPPSSPPERRRTTRLRSEISNGCYHELLLGMKRGILIKFFTVGGQMDMVKPIKNLDDLKFEQELVDEIDIEEFRQKKAELMSKVQ